MNVVVWLCDISLAVFLYIVEIVTDETTQHRSHYSFIVHITSTTSYCYTSISHDYF